MADEITQKIENTVPFLLSEYRVEVNSDTKEIKLIHKSTKEEKILSVNSDTPEGVYHILVKTEEDLHIIAQLIISGYFVTQDKKAINPNVSNKEAFLIEGFRLRYPELDFETDMFSSARSIAHKMADDLENAENVLLDFLSYVGIAYSKNKKMEIQVSKKAITKVSDIKQIPILILNFFLHNIKSFSIEYRKERSLYKYLLGLLVEYTEKEIESNE